VVMRSVPGRAESSGWMKSNLVHRASGVGDNYLAGTDLCDTGQESSMGQSDIRYLAAAIISRGPNSNVRR
jgi:hypothetical protein